MIELTMQRITKIEGALANSRSDWARNHWTQVLRYFQRRLQEQGGQV